MALGLSDRLARRIARNTQLILIEESNLARVSDPAAGSGGIEALTHEIGATAWRLFQEIEAAGGVVAALEQGLIQKKVAATRAEREAAVARRKDALTGTSEFPQIDEAPAPVLDVPQVALAPAGPVTVEALPRIRLAEPYEALRDAADAMLAKTGSRPKVFLANLGSPSDFTARATFAKNFFEAGGIEAATNDGFASREDMIAAFKDSRAALVCLCSSDKVYEAEAAEAAKALAASGATHLYLAGRPQAIEPALREAGVSKFIYAGCDVLAELKAIHHDLAG
jgi:methylmalonyl-CoA mutase